MTKDEALDKKAENARELGLDYEPVAWAHYTTFNNLNTFKKSRFTATLSKKETNACCVALYTAPQRTWIGLTDEEIEQGCKESWVTLQAWQSAVWWAEAKLKEKNT
jgi:hypothetical protein